MCSNYIFTCMATNISNLGVFEGRWPRGNSVVSNVNWRPITIIPWQRSLARELFLHPHIHRLPVAASASFHYLHQITRVRPHFCKSLPNTGIFRLLHAGTLYYLAGLTTILPPVRTFTSIVDLVTRINYVHCTAWDWQIMHRWDP